MSKFYTTFDRPKTKPVETGDGYEDVYEWAMKNGKKILTKTGRTNVYEIIQSELEDTLIENIIKRVTAGDEDALSKYIGQYFDCTQMPHSIAEAQEKIIQIQNEFEKLPPDIRSKFGNSPEYYTHLYGSNEWATIMGYNISRETKPDTKPTGGENNE